MTPSASVDPRYPIGQFQRPDAVSPAERTAMIRDLAELPAKLRAALAGFDDEKLDTPYRDGGWTVRQVVHHVADSHVNSYIRFKFALAETEPTIKPYDEKVWAELPEARTAPVEISLAMLDAIHRRLVMMLEAMSDADFARTLRHPEIGLLRLDANLALYSWHSRHHTAHVTALRDRMGWA